MKKSASDNSGDRASDEHFIHGYPVPQLSGTIYCIGRNYRLHAEELGNEVPEEPVIFLKSRAALRALEPVPLPFPGETCHYEAEIIIHMGRYLGMGASPSWDDVAGLGLGLDLTRRDAQEELKSKGLPWTTAKNFQGSALLAGYCPLARIPDPENIEFSFYVNDVLKQQGFSRDMLFPVLKVLSSLLSYHELRKGDLIFTGTPQGVGPVWSGDRIRLVSKDLGIDAEGVI